MQTRVTTIVLAALALAVFASSSWAATLRVGKRKPFKTIEAAVAVAADGDKIIVDRGVYTENVQFNGTIDRLQIIGRRATWDGGARDGSACLSGAGDGIVISGFTFRNGAEAISIDGDGTVIRGCRFRGVGGDSVDLDGADCRVERCSFRGASGRSIRIDGSGAIVQRNSIRNTHGDANVDDDVAGVIQVRGAGALIQRNSLRAVDQHAIWLRAPASMVPKAGDGGRVLNNMIVRCGGAGIKVGDNDEDGDNDEPVDEVLVQGNNIRFTAGDGVDYSGDNGTITNNKIFGGEDEGVCVEGDFATVSRNLITDLSDDEGVEINGDDATVSDNVIGNVKDEGVCIEGNRATVRRNRIANVFDNDAIEIDGDGDESVGSLVEGNRIFDCVEDGMNLCISNSTVRNNVIRVAGTDCLDAGIELDGDGNTIENNTIVGASGSGIDIDGDRNTVSRNSVFDCLIDGYFVESGTDNVLTRNSARGCDGEGLDNEGTNTTAERNTLRGNRIDLANSGSFSNDADADNSFRTGGSTTDGEIDCDPEF